jgi:hypothetical protein
MLFSGIFIFIFFTETMIRWLRTILVGSHYDPCFVMGWIGVKTYVFGNPFVVDHDDVH